jgi:epoxyqueuosine reductase
MQCVPVVYAGDRTGDGRGNAMTDIAVTRQITAQAAQLGFAAVGICAATSAPETAARLQAFLADGRHGDMLWLENRADERADPKTLWPEVKSIIMLGMSYAPASDPLQHHGTPDVGVVSVYAQGKDYHDVIKSKLKALAGWLVQQHGGDVKVFVDTAPVMEKPLAQAAGLGWQGKHTNLVSRDHGSWLFLGAIYTTLELPADVPHKNNCGSCTACQDVCPTQAFPAPYKLDARRCIAYLTIEHKGHIPVEFRSSIGNRIYGCDDCLAVCPWNKFAVAAHEMAFQPRAELTAPRLLDLVTLDDAAFREVFAGSPIKRIGRDRLVRNVLVALGNAPAKPDIISAVLARLADNSALVRGAAVWALSQLASPFEQAAAKARFSVQEPDPAVQAEWAMLPVD